MEFEYIHKIESHAIEAHGYYISNVERFYRFIDEFNVMRVCWGQPTTISASYFFRLLQEGSSARAHGYGFGFNRESDEGSNQLAPFYAHLLDYGALWKLRSGNVICNALPYTGNEAIMKHPERNRAKRIDSPDRCKVFTGIVYGGIAQNPAECYRGLGESIAQFMPPANEFFLFFGDLHGHSDLSDGKVDVDTFFKNQRDLAGTDFCALADHDHSGVGKPTLWQADLATGRSKWDRTLEKCDEYNEAGRFTMISAYERDSYPWYSNMILYYRFSENAIMYRGARDGEITERELAALAARDDILFGPHTCSTVSAGTDLNGRDPRLMPKTFRIYSRSSAYEYYDNPFPSADSVNGCAYIDALENGAHPACIACSDDHMGFCGRDLPAPAKANSYAFTGLTGIYARENTREALFDALRARRCYAFMGEKRIIVDFRIDGHYMCEIFTGDGDKRTVWFNVNRGDVTVSRVDLIKNGRSAVFFRNAPSRLVFDYVKERDGDYYYLRVLMADGRHAWTSPIWVRWIGLDQ